MNIYSRANRDANPAPAPLWKASSSSLNAIGTLDTPHEKRKEYDRKVKEKNQKSNDSKPNTERDKTKQDSDRREKPTQPVKQTFDEEDLAEHARKMEQERKRLEEEELELQRKDAAEKQRREEKDRIERLRREAAELEIERKRKQQEKEEEERRLKEKAHLEELERKKRWVANDIDEDTGESKKKNDLLAKLFSNAISEPEPVIPTIATFTPAPQPVVKKNIFESKPAITVNHNNNNNDSTSQIHTNGYTNGNTTNGINNNLNVKEKVSNTPDYKFPRKIENLHEGK